MLNKILAKSNGVDIITHTNYVVNNVIKLSNKYHLSEIEKEILLLSAILHDIGKITKKYQKILKKDVNIDEDEKIKYRHNIIGWYFIKNYLDHKYKDDIAILVLWHHANYNSCERLNEELSKIAKEITNEDITIMREFCNHYKISLSEYEQDTNIGDDNRFYKTDNFLRSILITSDVLASSNETIEILFNKENVDINNINKEFLSSSRSKEQLEIVDTIKNDTTTLIKAPAGFGKTMIGILWTLKRKNKLIWVCPTNVISESAYESIIKELKTLNINLSVELYLSGKREVANNCLNDFSSDIIVTNIDNFVRPSVTNSYGSRCLMIYDTDVIFDEIHEYDKMECAMFSCFNNIMKKRHNLLNSTTLLLTATQTTFMFKNLKGKPIEILPNNNEHYKAIHKKEYKIYFVDEIPNEKLNGEFVSFNNTISDVQNDYSSYNDKKLISHGRYLENSSKENKNMVLSNYGKNGIREPIGVFTNQMLTTACDYSVRKMFIKSPTIQSFFQSIGRLNRWGDIDFSEVYIVLKKSKSDIQFIGGDDENRLQESFIKELRETFEGKTTILDDLYVFYDKFIEKHNSLFNSISKSKNIKSEYMLKTIYPKRYKNSDSKTKIANSNGLRKTLSSDEIYIYVKKQNSDDWVTISFNINKNIGISKLFNEDENTYKKQTKIIKKFENYDKYKKITPETIVKEAVFYESPYPVFNHLYDEEIGLIKITN